MLRIKLYEIAKSCAHGDRPLREYYLPVRVGEDMGRMNIVDLIDNLYQIGKITTENIFGVSFNDDTNGLYPLDEIEVAGGVQIY